MALRNVVDPLLDPSPISACAYSASLRELETCDSTPIPWRRLSSGRLNAGVHLTRTRRQRLAEATTQGGCDWTGSWPSTGYSVRNPFRPPTGDRGVGCLCDASAAFHRATTAPLVPVGMLSLHDVAVGLVRLSLVKTTVRTAPARRDTVSLPFGR
jgi:hypothetical protein